MEVTDVNHHVDASSKRVLDVLNAAHAGDVFTELDFQALRLLLSGGSVVDWRRLSFRNTHQVAGFLSANGYDVHNTIEMARLKVLHKRALEYLAQTYELEVSEAVSEPEHVQDLFLIASGVSAEPEAQQAACAVLKVMHVLNHLDARRLVHHLSLSERALFLAAADKVDTLIGEMRAAGFGVLEYEPSTKTDHSLITKLISKPRVTAAQIFDKLRFRLVTQSRADLLPVVQWLLRQLFPFNHVIAGESHNTILTEDELQECLSAQSGMAYEHVTGPLGGFQPNNPATSPSFRMINFVVDLPVRINRLCTPAELVRLSHLGHLVHVTLEFQLFDAETVVSNEAGDGNHGAYKERQIALVSKRLWTDVKPRIHGAQRQSRQAFESGDEG